jgi:divalent metal cation (Fe/Co/Zn/Cd) transporter
VDGIIAIEKCFIRKAGMKYHVDLHAIVEADITVKEGHELAHRLKNFLKEEIPELGHVLIHVEPNSSKITPG